MKKLKKSTLDELANKMPVVSEHESAECIGGDYYFAMDYRQGSSGPYSDGYFMGSFGTGDNIKLIQMYKYSYAITGSTDAEKKSMLDEWSTPMSQNGNNELKQNILNYLFRQTKYNNIIVRSSFDKQYQYGLIDDGYRSNGETGIVLPPNAISPTTFGLARGSLGFYILGSSTTLNRVSSLQSAYNQTCFGTTGNVDSGMMSLPYNPGPLNP